MIEITSPSPHLTAMTWISLDLVFSGFQNGEYSSIRIWRFKMEHQQGMFYRVGTGATTTPNERDVVSVLLSGNCELRSTNIL